MTVNPFTPFLSAEMTTFVMHAATTDAVTTNDVADLDDQVAIIVAGLLALTSDPETVAAKAVGACDTSSRTDRLRRLSKWRDAEKLKMLGQATEASEQLRTALAENGNRPVPAVEEAEMNHAAAIDRYRIADAAADAAIVALADVLNGATG